MKSSTSMVYVMEKNDLINALDFRDLHSKNISLSFGDHRFDFDPGNKTVLEELKKLVAMMEEEQGKAVEEE